MPSHLANPLILDVPVVLLDMNGTFMFGGDRFGPDETYAPAYHALGGTLPAEVVDAAVAAAFAYLNVRYTDPAYHDAFPSVAEALLSVPEGRDLPTHDRRLIEGTFALHEVGHVPPEYVHVLQQLSRRHRLGLVADIWAERGAWERELNRAGVLRLFEALVFSSDGRSVKPSPEPFLRALQRLGAHPSEAVVVGDSARRDGGGAEAAGLPFVLVGGEEHPGALGQVDSLLTLA
ncbi:MAG: HAD family hydrolase [Bacteroidota bacterium]